MTAIDIRTFFTGYVLSILLCVIVMTSLWWQNRKRSPEIALWLADYVLQFIGLLLVTLRTILPDFLTIVVANLFIVGGTLALFIGLCRYVGRESRQLHNYVMLSVFTLVHVYFTYVYPHIELRNVNLSVALIFICAQCAWLMLRRVDPRLLPATKATGIVFAALCLVSFFQIVVNLTIPKTHNIFVSGFFNVIAILIYQILFVALTFALFLLVSRRLSTALESELSQRTRVENELRQSEEKFAKSFQTSPYAIAITRLQDGKFIDVNDAFAAITGYSREEVMAESSIGLKLWVNEENRKEMVSILRKEMPVTDREFLFRKKNGEVLTGLFSAQKIQLSQEPCLLSSINDITKRKQAEELIRIRLSLLEYAATHSLDELLQRTLDEVGILVDSPIGFYHFVENDQKTLSLQAWSTRTVKEFCKAEGKGMHYGIDLAGVWVDCVREKRPVIHNDYNSLSHRKGLPEGHAPVIRELVVPIMKGEKIMAILGIGNKSVDYTGKDVEIVSYLAGVAWEIADRKQEEEALRESDEHISAITNSANDAIAMMDNHGNISYWNPAAQRILGYTGEEAIGKNLHELLTPERFLPDYLAAFPEFQKTGRGNAIGKTLELAARRKDGHEIEVALSLSAVKIKEEWHSVGIIQDITERKKTEEQIKHLATHDLLTDLPSMGLAKDRLSVALNMARRYKKAVALMFIDLDGFKAVNDTLGHDAGDYVLQQVAQRLISCVRETDTVARVGGDEFLIIATEITAPENVAQIAEKVIQLVSQPVIFNAQQVVVGTSIGIALFPEHGENMDQLIKQADKAMYKVKNAGKNGFIFVNS